MLDYFNKLESRISVARHYVGLWTEVARLNFSGIKNDKEKAPEFEGLREEIFSWLSA